MATKKKATAIEEPEVRHISESEMERDARSTAEKLRAQERVKFTVMPDGSGDKKIRVKLNGTVWEYFVGVEQEAPRDVFTIIQNRWKTIAKLAAFENKNTNRDMGSM